MLGQYIDRLFSGKCWLVFSITYFRHPMLTHTPKSSTHIKFRNMLVVCLSPIPVNKPLNIQTKANISHMAHMRLHSKDCFVQYITPGPVAHPWWSVGEPHLVSWFIHITRIKIRNLPYLLWLLLGLQSTCQVLLLNKGNQLQPYHSMGMSQNDVGSQKPRRSTMTCQNWLGFESSQLFEVGFTQPIHYSIKTIPIFGWGLTCSLLVGLICRINDITYYIFDWTVCYSIYILAILLKFSW